MEYVTLKVKVDSADAKLNIQSVRKAVTELQTVSSKPITISVKATGLDTNIGGELERNLGQLDATAVKTGDTFTSLYAKIAKWGIMTSVVYGPIKAFREALTTLKAVDTEMVNVQKVTDYSKEQMEELEENAYALASAYGRTADEITAMYTTFARAGFLGDQLDSMTELGTLLANIGDISQDTASKFLLAVDAAWKLNGSESELMTVMDGLNEITNKNAVDMEALTSGITVAGSVFAEAGESAQTFSALVGAGVAATQRSGSEISRGLRTIVMNIRQIKGETEDGELIDGESIAKASKALREYAGISTMANGQLRLSSDVLKDLAGKWNSLDTVAQSAIAEALAGKRQANILTALMGSWDTVEKMMRDYADGAGSALKENEIYLDSWEAKSKQLTASWTEFVSHLVETDTIKGALDGVIGLVEFLDSDTGRLVVKVAALTAGVVALGNATKAALASEALKKFLSADIWKNLAQWFSWVSSGALSAGQSVSAFGQVLSQSLGGILPKLGIGAAIFAALAVAISLSTEKARAYEKSLEDVKAAQSALDETKSEYDELINKTEELTDAEKRRLEVLQATREEQEKQLEAAKKKAWEDWNAIHGTGATVIVDGMDANTGGMAVGAAKTERMDIVALRNYREELAQIEEQYRAGEMSAGEYYTALEKLNAAREESVETIRAAIAAGYDVTEEQKALVAAYDNTSIILGKVTGITYEWIASLIEEARAAGTAEDALYDTVSAAKILSNTKLDLNQQIQALAMLRFQLEQTAIQAAYTAKEISLVGLLTGTVGNIISSTVSSVLDGAGSAGQESGVSAAAGSSSGGSSGSGGSSDAAERKRAQAAIKELEKQRDAEIEPLEDQIDALKKQNEEIERGEKLEELKLDVLKKQDALLNARNERTVRQYNAATGQWEWVADANKVKDAEEDLENAKKDLRDYEREVELDLAVAELETRIEAIKAAYQIKIDAWQDYLDGLDGAVAAEGEYLNTSVKQNKDAAEAIADAWEEAAERKRKAQAAISAAAGAAADVPSSTNPSTSAAVSGAVGGAANSPSSTKPSASGAVAGAVGGAAKPKPSGGGGVNKVARYDSGGVLKGLGGIKATVDDEMVLPPDITEKMLRPSANGVFRQRMGELGYLYGVERPAAQNMAGKSDNRSYTDHSGPEYHYGSITLTKEQAETTTVAELRRMAHHLQPYGG
jgi:TP901 family phage tail tape measure protein